MTQTAVILPSACEHVDSQGLHHAARRAEVAERCRRWPYVPSGLPVYHGELAAGLGNNVSARRQHGPEVGRGRDDLGLGGLTRGLHKIRKPVIAAIDGWALAAGLELALACDLRIASDRAMSARSRSGGGFTTVTAGSFSWSTHAE